MRNSSSNCYPAVITTYQVGLNELTVISTLLLKTYGFNVKGQEKQ